MLFILFSISVESQVIYGNDGIDFSFSYRGDFWQDGTNEKFYYLDNFNIDLGLDLESLAGWKSTSFFAGVLGNNGKDPNELIGSVQGIDNIAAYNTWKLYQLYIEQKFAEDKFAVLAGLLDLNSEFDTREYSSVFINPSHGIGAEYALTGYNGPSIFPTTSLAFRVLYNYNASWNIRLAVFDGVSGDPENPKGTQIKIGKNDGALVASEITYQSSEEEKYFKYSVGGWLYTSEFPDIETGEMRKGNMGLYLSAEKQLYNEADAQGLGGFVRLGLADSKTNLVNAYYGAGLNYKGVIPGREEDVLGIAAAITHNNKKYVDIMKADDVTIAANEVIMELTYKMSFFERILIQPDLQYAINPVEGDQGKNYLVVGVRLGLVL
ncbi:MAG: hypothetical protein GXX85_01680 [Ignavibacteria bacterium]|nr:hypothetical protein [Ignavibacteria bacterium]